jgi:Domain of unknown function (DUF4402)
MHATSRILSGVLLLVGPAAFAQSSATASAVPATARIYAPITLTVANYHGGTGLSFGDIIAGASAGSVRLDPLADVRTPVGVTLPATSTMPVHSAQFTVGGTASAAYAITSLPTTVTLSSGTNTMTASNFMVSVNGAPSVPATPNPTGILGAVSANQSFTVGATLAVGANQLSGDYSGTFAVTVAYN